MSDLSTEWDVIKQVRDGKLSSPTRYSSLWLFRVRVTGTGFAHRPQLNEWCYRNPKFYLNKQFLNRVNGLPILLNHSEKGVVSGDEFHDKSIGILVCPYIKGSEVWGVAKVYDDTDAMTIVDSYRSTSPSVSFHVNKSEIIKLNDKSKLLIEGEPLYVDHLAMVPEGVWDKYRGAEGVDISTGVLK